MIFLIQHFEADFLWKVSLKILNSGIIQKTFTHGYPRKDGIQITTILTSKSNKIIIRFVLSGVVISACWVILHGVLCHMQIFRQN